ncbi:MAG TPA: hypothetical protein VGM88_07775 [Kofleriaceae bacterium]|jgi:hypothetical protein
MACLRVVGVVAILAVASVARADDPKPLPVTLHGGTAVLVTGGGDAELPLAIERDPKLAIRASIAGVARDDHAASPAVREIVASQPQAQDVSATGAARFHLPDDGPGIYDVEIELRDSQAAYLPLYTHALVYRRWGWLAAALCIAIGAIVAAAVRQFFDSWRAKLSARASRAALRAEIVAAGFEGDALERATAQLLADLDRAPLDAAAINGADKRFRLLQAVAASLPDARRLTGAGHDQVQTAIDAALAAVRKGADGIDAAISAFRGVDLDAAFRDQLAAAVAALDAQLQATPPGAPALLLEALAAARQSLDTAKAALASGHLDAAAKAVGTAQATALAALVTAMRALVGLATPLAGLTDAQWVTLRGRVEAALVIADAGGDWDPRNRALVDAQALYTTAAVDGLLALAAALPQTDEVTEITAELTAAKSDPRKVSALYATKLARLETLAAPPPVVFAAPVSTEAAFAAIRSIAASPLPTALALGDALHKPALAAVSDPKLLALAATGATWAVYLVVLLIAVASGLKALYLDDLSWGGFGAALTALLWGASVQAAGSFVGLRQLAAKIGGAAG